MSLLLLLACTTLETGPRQGPGEPAPDGGGAGPDGGSSSGTDGGDTGEGPTATTTGPCPAGMVEVAGFCVDRAEAALEAWDGARWVARSPYLTVDGDTVRAVVAWQAVPQGYISGDEAETACRNAGKRLCTSEEWLRACQGPKGLTWPYGSSWQAGACNDDYAGSHPVVDYFGTSSGVWDSEHMNDPGINQQPGTVAPGGTFTACRSAEGAYDLHGNLHEWVADADGTFRGGFYADASINGAGCTYRTTAHSRSYHDYSTGFRCCVDL